MKKFSITAFFSFAITFICLAHPGHGGTNGYTLIHYFVEPEHAILTYPLLISSILLLVYRAKRKKLHE